MTSKSGFTQFDLPLDERQQICRPCGVGVRLPGGRHGMTLAI